MKTVKHKEQRVAVFIDVQNLYYSARNLYQSKVNFGEILKQAVAGRKLVRAFAYVVRTKTGEEQPFFDALINLGIETRVRDLQEFFGGAKKADWDVGIVIDAIKTANSGVDVIVLVSGDGDFVPLAEYLKNQGKKMEVIAFGKTAAAKLREAADEFMDMEEQVGKYLLRDNKR